MQPNAMKAKLAAGEAAFGMSIMIPSPQLVEMAAGVGFDWVLIDCEHGTITLESAELMIMVAEASGVTPIVRPRTKAAQDIVEVMDRGAAGVQVPHVITKADAQAAVDAVKLNQRGRAHPGMAIAARSTPSPKRPIRRRWFACRLRTKLRSATSKTP